MTESEEGEAVEDEKSRKGSSTAMEGFSVVRCEERGTAKEVMWASDEGTAMSLCRGW